MPLLNMLSLERTDFEYAMVYTMEAHATDEWPISSARYEPSGDAVAVRQHQTIEERVEAAARFRATFGVPFEVLVDPMDNRFEEHFCTWPFRLYILQDEKVVWRAQPDGCTYHWLDFMQAFQAVRP